MRASDGLVPASYVSFGTMAGNWTAISATTRGVWHEKTGQKNQDSVAIKHAPHGAVIMAVSDGHGSPQSFRSDRGSALAVKCAVRLGERFLRRHGPDASVSRVKHQLQNRWWHEMLLEWRRAVREDIMASPFSPVDFAAFPEPVPVLTPRGDWPFSAYLAYGATLLVAVLTRNYHIYGQLGDGDILTVTRDGGVTRPFPSHHEFFDEQSASLCTHGALHEFQTAVLPARHSRPALVMLSTDGYANCFGNDEGFFKVGSDLLTYADHHGAAFVGSHLRDWLGESSREGSGDDITVALAARRRTASA